jgi:hypothetical protein
MKKLFLLPLLFLASCGVDYTSSGSAISFYTDKQTGCQYLVQTDGGIYQRMKADGTQVCD